MEGKVVSKRQLKRDYKGEAPHRTVSVISWISKLLLQFLIFTLIYALSIEMIKDKYHNLFIEFLFVSFWLIIADLSAYLTVLIVKILIIGKTRYILSVKREKRNYSRKIIEYVCYIGIRSFFYVIGLVLLLTILLSERMPLFWAYLFIWLGIFIISKLLAKLISVWFTKTIY
ncbi:hypothetical protein LCGC14_0931870 [marine sediment metagenome]|uniref:Uncharacterized protein n=1 Tax=marine sediment metagenome TaxID=412755 RepID=A0A0F9NSD5_9ZZZZ|nr:MAG: hypothetical protein Lokiarch_21380 [Candidatus Lokiarchaeum sp. GC14_75]